MFHVPGRRRTGVLSVSGDPAAGGRIDTPWPDGETPSAGPAVAPVAVEVTSASDLPVAVVVGGATGAGRATVLRLGAAGHRLAVLDRSGGTGDRSGWSADRDGPLELDVDVTSPRDVQRAVADVVDAYGRVDVLVNAAGLAGPRCPSRIHDTSVDEWDRLQAVTMRAPFLCARAVLPAMLARGGGHVVTLASVAGLSTGPGHSALGAAHAGAVHLTRTLAADYAAHGVRANAVCVGVAGTVSPDEVAAAVATLTTGDLRSATGQVLVLDGVLPG